MERVAQDDEQAFASLVATLAPSLLRFIQQTARIERPEAEDLAQEVFIRLWKARHRWRPTASVKGYVFTIASRLCLNHARGRRRAPLLEPLVREESPSQVEVQDGAALPDRLLHAHQLGAAIEEELSELPANQRAALLLRHGEDLTYQEIAAALDTSESAVESLLSRARARLRARLAPWMTEGNLPDRG